MILFSFDYPSSFQCDFSQDPICFVPLKITVENPKNEPLDFSFEAVAPNFIPSHMKNTYSNNVTEIWGGGFISCGQTLLREKLAPNSKTVINFSAGFVKEGIYNLNRFKFLLYGKDDNAEVEIVSTNQYIIKALEAKN